MSRFPTVPDGINFPTAEDEVLNKWRKEDTFKKSMELSKGRPHYTFYDGPPFATGLPHYGHILAGTIKDVVTRWAHQTGHHVERRFGWDTHGLPVEYEIDKTLNITGPKDVEKMGIAAYNNECRSIVMRYADEWQKIVERIGRWIDFENDYKTLYPWFMESVWWVFSELFKKDLVYRGVKVMPYSTGCCTPLSNFEAGQNYKDVVDPAAYVGFELVSKPNRYLVAWTTTPWTLPSNLAVAVHPDLEYVVAKRKSDGKELIVLKERLIDLFGKDPHDILETFPGKELQGLEYKPVFPYFEHLRNSKVFHVLTGTFVTTDQGTGIVHQAPYFGEIDHQMCLEAGVIQKDGQLVCPVDANGCFTEEVTDFAGKYVKDADKEILKKLKDNGTLIKQGQVKHSYPFCWRSDTPLLYRAVPSWFIKVESFSQRLLEANQSTYWVPTFVKEKRFANWLRDARDWAVSRNRYWGTPINLWVSEDFSEIVCPSSIAELEELCGTKVTDLHRESVDQLTFKSKKTGKTLHRVSEVFDCWFESGSMPYAQLHYPFENQKHFEENFPADFIAEGIDQTRGWFYTLLVLSTALFNKAPFKNLIANGLILASDGSKMSKRKKNYPDPMEIVHKYGADALRVYLINSPVVRGENLKFREEGVRDVLKDVLLPWFNAFRMFLNNVTLYEIEIKKNFELQTSKPQNVMDQWILSFTNSLVTYVRKEMDAYHLYAVMSPLTKYFDTLTNTYIRLNRNRFKSDNADEADRLNALSTLGHVLTIVVRLMSPFTPFFCEYLWTTLRQITNATEQSVHFTMIPDPETEFIDETVERRVAAMRQVIDGARVLRERKSLSVRYPLKEVVVVNRDQTFLDDVISLKEYILSELNVKELTVSQDKSKYGVQLKAEPNFRLLGERLKANQKKVVDYLKNKVTDAELEELIATTKLTVLGHDLTAEEVGVSFTCSSGAANTDATWEAQAEGQTVVLLNTTIDDELLIEGLSRELVSRIQRLRKDAKLQHYNKATVFITFANEAGLLATAAKRFIEAIVKTTGTTVVIVHDGMPEVSHLDLSAASEHEIRDERVRMELRVDDARPQ